MNHGDKAIYAEFLEKGFKIIKLERETRTGGGLAILINRKVFKRILPCYKNCEHFDNVGCTIIYKKTKINIVNLYRPPSQSKSQFLKSFDSFLSILLEKEGITIIVGDFNIDLNKNDSITQSFLNLLNKYDLSQLVNTCTRDSSLLDLIIIESSQSAKAKLLPNNLSVFRSDHKPILFKLKLNEQKTNNSGFQTSIRNLKKLEIKEFESELIKSDLVTNKMISKNSDEFVEVYEKSISEVLNKICPKTSICLSLDTSKKWYNSFLLSLKQEKRRAERAYIKHPTLINKNLFINSKHKYNKALKQTRTDYYSEALQKHKTDGKNLHKALNELSGNKITPVYPTLASEKETSEKMALFYVEKIEKLREDLLTENLKQKVITKSNQRTDKSDHIHLSQFREINSEELRSIIKQLKKKTCLLDPCPSTLLMNCLDLLLPLYLNFINNCIKHSHFPDSLKHAVITPIIKNNSLDPETYKNYRPVSSLPFMSKLLEKVLHIQLNDYLEINNMYPSFQSAYRAKHSCETTLLKMTDDIQKAVSEKKITCLITLDLSSAFDTIDKNILLNKLNQTYKVEKKALEMIQSYFNNRTFAVKINETISKTKNLKFGVPQGSLLGPLFYILYADEFELIAEKYKIKIQCYADDCQLYVSFQNNTMEEIEKNIIDCLNEIKAWTNINYLKLNADKTKIKIIKHKLSIMPKFKLIEKIDEESIKILGVLFEENLRFSDFIVKKVKTCNFQIRNLYNIKNSLNISTKIMMVSSLIFSTVDYCNILLLSATAKELRPLKLVTNKAVRFIFNVNPISHITPYYKKAHFLPIKLRIRFKACFVAYKIFHGIAPFYLNSEFTKFIPNQNVTLREGYGRDIYMFTIVNEELKYKTLSYLIKVEWNSLPLAIRKCAEIEMFKSNLKTHLFSQF